MRMGRGKPIPKSEECILISHTFYMYDFSAGHEQVTKIGDVKHRKSTNAIQYPKEKFSCSFLISLKSKLDLRQKITYL